jgi:hypothetical protein
VKKRSEDYDQMLQYYTFMKIKSKMKDFDVESKEWWEVEEEFVLRSWRVDERTYKYKLEVYQKTFPNFVRGSPTNIMTSNQKEENEAGPNGTVEEEEVQVKEPQILYGKIKNHR